MRFEPQRASRRGPINPSLLPPCGFIATAIHLAMVSTAQWNNKLVAHFAPQRPALRRWSALQLANQSAVGVTTIRRAELTDSETKLTRVNDHAIRRTLDAAGVEFIDAEGGGPGVRLRQVPGKSG
jgi:hypothetical protein